MDKDRRLRRNRIAFLQSIQWVISRTAWLTEVVVDRAEHWARFGVEQEGGERS